MDLRDDVLAIDVDDLQCISEIPTTMAYLILGGTEGSVEDGTVLGDVDLDTRGHGFLKDTVDRNKQEIQSSPRPWLPWQGQ